MLEVATRVDLPHISPRSRLHTTNQARVEAMLEVLTKLRSAHRARLPPEIGTQLENAV